MTTVTRTAVPVGNQALVSKFIQYMETQTPPEGLFARDAFLDFTSPRWREQALGVDEANAIRRRGHPGPSTVVRWRADDTEGGFLLEWEERWAQDGEEWYCREMARADVVEGAIAQLSVYCTGDWDRARVAEHAVAVKLTRP